MSFTFNWAGFTVPNAAPRDPSERMSSDLNAVGANVGAAARGYEKMQADREYSALLGDFRDRGPRLLQLRQELAKLRARNAEIAQQLGI
jgi:hypothetical protein